VGLPQRMRNPDGVHSGINRLHCGMARGEFASLGDVSHQDRIVRSVPVWLERDPGTAPFRIHIMDAAPSPGPYDTCPSTEKLDRRKGKPLRRSTPRRSSRSAIPLGSRHRLRRSWIRIQNAFCFVFTSCQAISTRASSSFGNKTVPSRGGSSAPVPALL